MLGNGEGHHNWLLGHSKRDWEYTASVLGFPKLATPSRQTFSKFSNKHGGAYSDGGTAG